MRKILKYISLLLVAFNVFLIVGCSFNNPSDLDYWFSKNSEEFIEYDEDKNNLNEAGSYWYFTSSKDVDITLNVKMSVGNFSSYAYLYVNDKQVKSELDTNIYSYVYKLSLKKGDVIKLHATWVNGLSASEEPFKIYTMVIGHDGSQYLIKDFDNSTTA